ncbi:MAG TPA: DUF3443 domain-containing protein [Steroidobacteraceae bacterium]|nr:DUF3443 domain-containing protein [Steroidobacteraceae bacterium]
MRSIYSLILAALVSLTVLAGCGGSGNGDLSTSGSGSQTIAPAANNVVTMTVNGGPLASTAPNFNIPYVSVTVCAHGSTSNCQTIDNIQVDTGSYGLRLISSVVSSSLLSGLTQVNASTGSPLVECTQFADGYSWGSVRTADVQISGETAANVPIQLIGDSGFTNIPGACSSGLTQEDTVETFGANGILGVGPFVQDCSTACVDSTTYPYYWSCPTGGGTCSQVQVTLAQEVSNPVYYFTTDNNGVIVELPSIADAGAASATGSLVFGIGTESNNALSSGTKVLTTDDSGYITITFNGTAYTESYIDSGSNLLYFVDNSLTQCTLGSGSNAESFFCPSSEQSLSATNQGQNGATSTVNFQVANAQTQLNTSNTAFDNVAAPNSNSMSFDFGVPFFYGRNIYVAIASMAAGGTTGPYFAY